MNRTERRSYHREAKQFMAKVNATLPDTLVDVHRDEWPNLDGMTCPPVRVLRSRGFLVQVYEAPAPAVVRLSIHRSRLNTSGGWVDGITWDELMRLKHEAGYGAHDAVEVYPPDRDVVNVANIRHLWVLADRIPFAWRKN